MHQDIYLSWCCWSFKGEQDGSPQPHRDWTTVLCPMGWTGGPRTDLPSAQLSLSTGERKAAQNTTWGSPAQESLEMDLNSPTRGARGGVVPWCGVYACVKVTGMQSGGVPPDSAHWRSLHSGCRSRVLELSLFLVWGSVLLCFPRWPVSLCLFHPWVFPALLGSVSLIIKVAFPPAQCPWAPGSLERWGGQPSRPHSLDTSIAEHPPPTPAPGPLLGWLGALDGKSSAGFIQGFYRSACLGPLGSVFWPPLPWLGGTPCPSA